ncbi:MAG: extracellular solute-binding protein [Hyphomicrobiaceae bacterium]|nr:extracellular solute-binding protein [Hyphomicrobiaceae bacterium]
MVLNKRLRSMRKPLVRKSLADGFARALLSFSALALPLLILSSGPALAKSTDETTDCAVLAENGPKKHALSLIGTPSYPKNFKHFKYVNASAPKGGRVRLGARGSYDTLNLFTGKGDSAVGLGLLYDSLMDQSLDEPSTSYCLLCEWVSYPKDYSSVTFKLRKEAKWHDGKPVTVDDVIFSFETFTKHNPSWKFYYKNVTSAKKTGPLQVTFTFSVKGNRELPQIMGDLTIMPKHYWTDTDAHYVPRDPSKSTLIPPLGSGPYKIDKMKRGASMTYKRVKDYWARDLPISMGRYNFDKISYTYYRDDTVSLEAFKGGQLDYRQETSSKNWATAYRFPAFKKALVKKQLITLKTAEPMQAFVLNTRRSKFKDPRVRQAFSLAFNFEWTNKNLFYGQYKRVSSYFENTELAAQELPTGKELAILTKIKDLVPPEVFTKTYKLPINQTSRDFRKHMRKAAKLLKEAGWKIKNGVRHFEKTGEPLTVEFLLVQPSFERVIMPYINNLKKIGIRATIRNVDSSQYVRRTRKFDFDIVIGSFRQSRSPGNEQRNNWGSAACDKEGSRNIIGIKDKGVDHLIDQIIFAKSRPDLVAAAKALDRVLLWNHYVVPQWYAPAERIAYWDKFGQPKTLPTQNIGFLATWWIDKDKAQKLAKAGG